jgi:hypothetical protein
MVRMFFGEVTIFDDLSILPYAKVSKVSCGGRGGTNG